MVDERYPTGKFTPKGKALTPEERTERIERIRNLPQEICEAVEGLDDAQLDTPYREGGWSPRQIVHHLADSHLNAFIRLKLGLTEERPTIKPYDQAAWASLPDSEEPVGTSLAILDGLHARWAGLLDTLDDEDFALPLVHPEMGDIDMDFLLDLYAWHGHHHTTQVVRLREREGWS